MSPVATLVTTETAELLRQHRIHQGRKGNMPSTIEKRDASLRSFAQWLDPRGLLEATRQDIETFIDKHRARDGRQISSRTRYSWIATFHAFYLFATNEELIDADPTVKIIRPKQRRTLPRPINGDDLTMAIGAAQPQMKAILSLAAFAGLRVQEIAGLERDDIIESKDLIRVRHGKGDKERIIPLHPDVMAALRCVPMPKTGYLFRRPQGGRSRPTG